MTTSSKVSRTLVDNWILELAFGMLSSNYESNFSDHWITKTTYPWELERDPSKPIQYHSLIRGWSWEDEKVKSILTALLQILDLLVFNDELVYEYEFSQSWKDFPISKPIEPLLHQVKLDSQLKRKLILNQEVIHFSPDSSDVVRQGAIHYLALSRLLGVFYWPAPKRAEYLQQQIYARVGSSFILKFKDFLDQSLEQIINEVLIPLKTEDEPYFSGFSTTILSSCDTSSAIIPTLLQVRESSAGLKFREWLREMDDALQKGDLRHIALEMKKVKDVISEVRRDLGLGNNKQATVEFQIGISPALVLDNAAMRSIANQFIPKPYHLVFIRNYFYNFLENANTKHHLLRLFPYLRQTTNE